jgi:hypothetical protein
LPIANCRLPIELTSIPVPNAPAFPVGQTKSAIGNRQLAIEVIGTSAAPDL